jgi:hypothetical protein
MLGGEVATWGSSVCLPAAAMWPDPEDAPGNAAARFGLRFVESNAEVALSAGEVAAGFTNQLWWVQLPTFPIQDLTFSINTKRFWLVKNTFSFARTFWLELAHSLYHNLALFL